MNSSRLLASSFVAALMAWPGANALKAQDFPSNDPVIRAIWAQGMEESEAGAEVRSGAVATAAAPLEDGRPLGP